MTRPSAPGTWTRSSARHGLPFPKSEPEAFVHFSESIPEWCVLVGLIGSGQEIHDGEAGLGQWRTALEVAGDPGGLDGPRAAAGV